MPTNSTIRQILDLTDYSLGLNCGKHPGQGQLVITGLQAGGVLERRIGFCVQIRRQRGQFGSDMVFLRHPDGMLVTHENQSYFGMTTEQEALARPLFTDLPEDEDYTQGYRCCAKVHEVGFIIEESASQPSPATPTLLTLTQAGPDGAATTCLALI